MTDDSIKAAKARAVEGESCDDPNVRIALCDEALRRGDRIRELEAILSTCPICASDDERRGSRA